MAEILTLYNNPTGTGRTLTWEQGESGSHTYDLIIIDQTGQPVDLTGCSVALYFKPPSGTIQIGATVSSSGDSASLTVPGEATQSPGAYQAWVAVVRPSPQQNIIINNLAVIIRENVVDASAPEAEPYFGTLTQMIADGQALINDLEQQTPWPVSKGGTGASTAAGARANLGVAATDHTHSLSGSSITGVLPITKGGTGATYPVAARIALGAVGTDDIIQISKGGTGGVTAQMAMTNIQNDPSVAWKTLSLAPGVEPGTYGTRPTPSYRKIGNHVKIEGGVSVNIPGTSPVLLATVPAGFRPLENVYVLRPCSGFRATSVYLTTEGNLYLGWVFNLDSATRYTGDLSWMQIDMDFYVDGANVNMLGLEKEASTNASA